MNPLAQYPIPHKQVAGRVIDGEAVLVLSETGDVQVLNEAGGRIWELADGSRSLAQIVAALVSEFDVSEAEATADVLEFIARLEKERVVVMSDRPSEL